MWCVWNQDMLQNIILFHNKWNGIIMIVFSCLVLWVKFSADAIQKYFSYFSQKTGFDISCKLSTIETICMKCQNLFSEKNKINIINLSADFYRRVVNVKYWIFFFSLVWFSWNFHQHLGFDIWSWNKAGQLKNDRGAAGKGKRGGLPVYKATWSLYFDVPVI